MLGRAAAVGQLLGQPDHGDRALRVEAVVVRRFALVRDEGAVASGSQGDHVGQGSDAVRAEDHRLLRSHINDEQPAVVGLLRRLEGHHREPVGTEGPAICNDHLNVEDHKQWGTGDHGGVRVHFRHDPA